MPKKDGQKKYHRIEPGEDIRFYRQAEMERDILYLQGILGLEACKDPPTKRETMQQHDRRIRDKVAAMSERSVPSDAAVAEALAHVQATAGPAESAASAMSLDALYMGAAPVETRLQAAVRRAVADGTQDHVRDIVRAEYLPTQADLHGRVHELKNEIKRANKQQGKTCSLEELDDQVKHAILSEPGCPESVRALSKDRPSAFDIYASFLKFKPQFVAIQLRQAQEIELGRQTRDSSYFSVFTQMPRGREIVRGIQEQAMREERAKTKKVNFQ